MTAGAVLSPTWLIPPLPNMTYSTLTGCWYDVFDASCRPLAFSAVADASYDVFDRRNSRLKRFGKCTMFRDYFHDRNEGKFKMPSKRGKKDDGNKLDFSYKSTVWANVPLSGEDTAEIIERAKNTEENMGDLLSLFASGCNISIKYRPDGTTVSCVAIFAAGVHGNHPVGLSAFAPDAPTAVSALLYKYFVVAGSDLQDFVSASDSRIG